MANAVVSLDDDYPISFDYNARFRSCAYLKCTFDTLASDLTVFTPDADKRWGIAGILYSANAAHTLQITSNSTVLVGLALSSGGLAKGPGSGDGFLATGIANGDSLKLQFITALAGTVLLYVAQFKPIG